LVISVTAAPVPVILHPASEGRSRVTDNIGGSTTGVNNDADLSALMGAVAEMLLGARNKGLSSRTEWRYGSKGSLAVDLLKGTFYDHECGEGGGVFDLIKRETGRTDGMAWLREQGLLDETGGRSAGGHRARKTNGHINGGPNGHDNKDAEAKRRLDEARRIAAETKPIRATSAAAYLKSRGIDINAGKLSDKDLRDVRFHPGDPDRGYRPMLVGLLRDPETGELPGSIHRTPINADGTRARKDNRILDKKGLGRYGSGMLCVGDMLGEGPVFISEGIEDLLSATNLTGTKGMATLGSGRLGKLRLKEGAQVVLIAQQKTDWDRHTWLKAAQRLAEMCEVEIVWPGQHADLNDLLKAEGPDAVRKVIEAAQPVERATQLNSDANDNDNISVENDEHDDEKLGYRFSPGRCGIEYLARSAKGAVWVLLANFKAKIVSQIRLDDGVEMHTTFEIEATINGRISVFLVHAAQFSNMNWVLEHLGAEAVVQPGQGAKDRVRAAIQTLSRRIPQRSVYAHTGWRQINNEMIYLHGGGAVGADGPVDGLEVQLPKGLENYVLTVDGTDKADMQLMAAVKTTIRFLNVAPLCITVPLFAAVPRAIIGGSDFSIHLSGLTGVMKTELAALVQQCFGPSMHSRALPGSWTSTDNMLEATASATKDAIMVIDDFVPGGTTADRARLNAKADRVLRAQGNASGRGRMKSDGTLRYSRPPRGQLVSTGEEIPAGQSLRARMAAILVSSNDIDVEHINEAQRHAADGLYSRATAGFIRWMAPNYEAVRQEFKRLVNEWRTEYPKVHGRTADVFAQMRASWMFWLRYAVDVGAITAVEADNLMETVRSTLSASASEQTEHQRAHDAVNRFFQLLNSVLSSGKAHIANVDHVDKPPPGKAEIALRVGWKRIEVSIGESMTESRWVSQGPCIGWWAKDGIYLDPDAAFGAVQQLGNTSGEGVGVASTTLFRRMRDRKLLLSTERTAGETRLRPRKSVGGKRHHVLHVAHELSPYPGKTGPTGPTGPAGEEDAQFHGNDEC
jgi:hypothetical protein